MNNVAEVMPSSAPRIILGIFSCSFFRSLSLLTPEFPNEVDKRMVEEEDWIVGGNCRLAHVTANELVDLVVRVFEFVEFGTAIR